MRPDLLSPAQRCDYPASNIDQKERSVSRPLLNITSYVGFIPNIHMLHSTTRLVQVP